MQNFDAFSLFDVKTEQQKQEFEQTILKLLKEWHEYKLSTKNGAGFGRHRGLSNAVRLDDVVMSLRQPGINWSDEVRELFQDYIESLKEKKLVRNARDFNDNGGILQYGGTDGHYEFTDDGYRWFLDGASELYSFKASEYLSKITTSLCVGTATDLATGLEYLEEGHKAFHSLPQSLLKATGFMIGAASEFLVSKIYGELQANYGITPGGGAGSITAKMNDVTNWLGVNANINQLAARAGRNGFDDREAGIIVREFRGILGRIGNIVRMDPTFRSLSGQVFV